MASRVQMRYNRNRRIAVGIPPETKSRARRNRRRNYAKELENGK